MSARDHQELMEGRSVASSATSISTPPVSHKPRHTALHELSGLLNTGLDKQSLRILVNLCEAGVNPEALAMGACVGCGDGGEGERAEPASMYVVWWSLHLLVGLPTHTPTLPIRSIEQSCRSCGARRPRRSTSSRRRPGSRSSPHRSRYVAVVCLIAAFLCGDQSRPN